MPWIYKEMGCTFCGGRKEFVFHDENTDLYWRAAGNGWELYVTSWWPWGHWIVCFPYSMEVARDSVDHDSGAGDSALVPHPLDNDSGASLDTVPGLSHDCRVGPWSSRPGRSAPPTPGPWS